MARLSKANHFLIYEDIEADESDTTTTETTPDQQHSLVLQSNVHASTGDTTQQDADHDPRDDIDRRESGFTASTVSSFPESTYQVQIAQPSCPIIRASFRRPESVKRMQMSMTPPMRNSSAQPRRSISSTVDPYYSSDIARSSLPGAETQRLVNDEDTEDEVEEEDEDPLSYPLVLLHATLLPVSLPWSMKTMQEVLPAQTLKNLHLLRAKISDTMVQRGILMPHPHEDYELLEERILEALELKPERITKCGHFRARHSTDSDTSTVPADDDSALGSSGSESDLCSTCHHHIKVRASKACSGQSEWSIKIFAANGLMRAPTWAAVWNEMERIDMEVLPWIDEESRRELDRRRDEEDTQEELRQQEEETRIRELVEEQVHEAYEQKKRAEAEVLREQARQASKREDNVQPKATGSGAARDHRPPVYRPSQVPISVLLRNYVYLLAQDRRNVAMVVLIITTMYFALLGTGRNFQADLNPHWHKLDSAAHTVVPMLPPGGSENFGCLADSHSSSLIAENTFEGSIWDAAAASATSGNDDDQFEFLDEAASGDGVATSFAQGESPAARGLELDFSEME